MLPVPLLGSDVGIVVLDETGLPTQACGRALALLECSDIHELRARWPQWAPAVGRARPDAGPEGAPGPGAGQAEPKGSLHWTVRAIGAGTASGWFAVVTGPAGVEKHRSLLRQAARQSGFASLFRHAAHDLRGSLNALSLTAQLVDQIVPRAHLGARTDVFERSMRALRDEVAHINRDLDALLDRRLADDDTIEAVDVVEIVSAVRDLVNPRAASQHVQVSLGAPAIHCEVRGHASRLHAAVLALVVNALDAMPDGGTLDLGVARTPAGRVRIQVADSGSGVPLDAESRLWDLHFTTRSGHAGIGLSVARDIAAEHLGDLRLQPREAGGATFVLDLPLASA